MTTVSWCAVDAESKYTNWLTSFVTWCWGCEWSAGWGVTTCWWVSVSVTIFVPVVSREAMQRADHKRHRVRPGNWLTEFKTEQSTETTDGRVTLAWEGFSWKHKCTRSEERRRQRHWHRKRCCWSARMTTTARVYVSVRGLVCNYPLSEWKRRISQTTYKKKKKVTSL